MGAINTCSRSLYQTHIKSKQMSLAIIFFIGFLVFGTVIISFILAVSESGRNRRYKYKSEEEDSIDYDGGGNWGRIPPKKK